MSDRSIYRIAWRLLNAEFNPDGDTYKGVCKEIHNACLEAGWRPPTTLGPAEPELDGYIEWTDGDGELRRLTLDGDDAKRAELAWRRGGDDGLIQACENIAKERGRKSNLLLKSFYRGEPPFSPRRCTLCGQSITEQIVLFGKSRLRPFHAHCAHAGSTLEELAEDEGKEVR